VSGTKRRKLEPESHTHRLDGLAGAFFRRRAASEIEVVALQGVHGSEKL
jgi:hypothetical protein